MIKPDLKHELSSYLIEQPGEYYMLFTPYPIKSSSYQLTVFKVENKAEAAKQIINFVSEEIGKIESVINCGMRFDFYVSDDMYSLFKYDQGVIVIK